MAKKIYVDEYELRKLYCNQKKSISQISKILKIGKSSVGRGLKKYNIKSRTLKEAWKTHPRIFSEDTRKKIGIASSKNQKKLWRNPLYKKKLIKIIKENGFKRRKLKATDEELYDLYWNKHLTPEQISEIYNVSFSCINNRFLRSNIPKRSYHDSIKYHRHKLSEKGRKSVSEAITKRNLEDWKNKKYRDNMVNTLKQKWKDPEFSKKMFKALAISPNKPETFVLNLIININANFFYNKGEVNVDGKIPDFVNLKAKKILEVHGRAFHDPNFKRPFVKNIPYHRTKEGTEEHYTKNGYECLVVWDLDLHKEETINQIKQFCVV